MSAFFVVFYFEVFILISGLTLLRIGHCVSEDRDLQTGMTTEVTNICARNSPCKYAICLWWNRNGNLCNLVPLLLDSNCVCPPTQVCSLTAEMSDDGSPLSYRYRCRDPRRALGIHHV